MKGWTAWRLHNVRICWGIWEIGYTGMSEIMSLGTIKASQVVVLNEDSVVVTQWKLMQTTWSSSSNWIWLRWETYTLKVVFVEHYTHFNVYVSQRGQIQFEAVYMSFRWVTITCLHWEPQPVTLWLYPMIVTLQKLFTSCQPC